MYRFPDAVIMVFCKAPVPGEVKTRLIPPLSPEEAARLHCELTELTLQTATKKNLCAVQLWCASDVYHPFFGEVANAFPISLELQHGADLGERMHNAYTQALAQYRYAIIIGCDCPALTPADLEFGLQQLSDGKQCVIAPAEDGGYVLIGLTQPQPALFENMPWGTGEVLELTRAKLKLLNIEFNELDTQWDIDTLDDFNRYRCLID